MMTPWGRAEVVDQIADGIQFVSTASHGGYYLSSERVEEMHPKHREFADRWSKGWGDQWYEEDCAALAVVVTFHDEIGIHPEDLETAKKMLASYVDVS